MADRWYLCWHDGDAEVTGDPSEAMDRHLDGCNVMAVEEVGWVDDLLKEGYVDAP